VPLISLKHRFKKLGITNRQAAEHCNRLITDRKISEQRISELLNGHLEGELADQIHTALEHLISITLRERAEAVTA
jgi:hypothetical protein